jgi:hypothetical protein
MRLEGRRVKLEIPTISTIISTIVGEDKVSIVVRETLKRRSKRMQKNWDEGGKWMKFWPKFWHFAGISIAGISIGLVELE